MSSISKTVFVLLSLSLNSGTDSQPVVSISPGTKISASLGTTVNLTCSVDVQDSSPGVISSITWKFGTEVLSDGVSTMLDQGVSSLDIGSIKSGQAGSYSCEAVVDSSNYANTTSITVQLPSVNDPVLSPFPFIGTFYSGIEITFQCIFFVDINAVNNDPDTKVTSDWKKGDTKLTSDSRITVNNPKPVPGGSNGQFTGLLKFDYLTKADSDDYGCEVFVNSSVNSDFVVETSASSTIVVTVNAPTPVVSLTSTSVRVPNLDGYNNVSLTCTATLPLSNELEFAKVFKWTKDGTDITTSDPTNPKGVVSVSTLNTIMTNAGESVFKCEVSISVTGDPVVTNSSSLTITVLGPTDPNEPSELKAQDVRYNRITVQWTVSILAYDPEKYVVYYGTDESSLTSNSSTVYSIKDFSRINETYSVTLTDLVYDTVYYYQVESMNSHGTATSDTSSFKTKKRPPTAPPENFTISVISSTALNMSWNPPPEEFRHGAITNYTLTCNETVGDVSQLINSSFPMLITQNDSVSIVRSGFRPGTLITCSVSASNYAGTGPPATSSATTDEERPGGTPENFMILSRTSRSFILSWSPPDPFLQNGVILGYILTCREKLSGTVPSSYPRTNYPHPPPSSVVADDLRPFTEYTCDLTAVNSAGNSDPAIDSSITKQDAPDGRPTDFKVSQTSSRSLTFTWRPIDPLLQNGIITNYTLKCNSSMMYPIQVSPDDNKEVSNGEYSVLIQGLIPGTTYQCTVYANTSEGAGPEAVVIKRTFEEKPGNAPLSVSLSTESSTSVLVTWLPPELPYGAITHYTVYVTRISCRNDTSMSTNVIGRLKYLITGLSPYQLVKVQISASTAIGEGPRSDREEVRSEESAPGLIRGIKFTASSHTELVVAIPVKQDISVARGVITSFYCSIISYTGDNPLQEESFSINDNGIHCVDVESLADIDGEDLHNITFKGLVPEKPYNVSVHAMNSAGNGTSNLVIVFSQQGRPPAPKNVRAEPINGTAIIVYWQKIDIVEARGHISGYVVSYSHDSGRSESQELTENKTMGPDESQAVLSDLRKGGTYRVSVSAFNSNGDVGDASEPIILLITTESKGSSVAVIVPVVCVLVILITTVAVILLVFFLRRLHQRFIARRSVNLKENLSSEKGSQVLSDIIMTKSPAYEGNVFSQQPSEVSKLEPNPSYVVINREFHLYERVENFHQPPRLQSTCCEYEIPQR